MSLSVYSTTKLITMKKKIFTGINFALAMLVVNLISYGQAAVTSRRLSNPASSAENAVSESAVRILGRHDVYSKAMKSFTRSFRNVSNEKWYEVDNALIATFTSDDIDCRVDYNKKKGYWLHTMRTYDETKMPGDLRHAVKSTYYDYEINLVHEIESPNAPVTYIVQLIGKTKVIKLRICEGEMEEWQKFEKSN